MSVYYNENEKSAGVWLGELRTCGMIPIGVIDERGIEDVKRDDVAEYTQCHFFAGIGGWPRALELAGWSGDRPVWTGSCPCQPFSVAGKGRGAKDKRHLWPEFRRLIAECRPPTIFGEQVASPAGRGWLAGVRADLEALGYAVGAADLCAAGVGAPHIRQRLYWVAHLPGDGREARDTESERPGEVSGDVPCRGGADGGVAHTDIVRSQGRLPGREDSKREDQHRPFGCGSPDSGMGNTNRDGREQRESTAPSDRQGRAVVADGGAVGFWDEHYRIPFKDGKARRLKPGLEPLAHGVPGRVGLLRGYGNAIVPQLAAEFVRAFMETRWRNDG